MSPFALSLLLFPLAEAPAAAPETSPEASQQIARIEEAIAGAIEQPSMVGLSVAVGVGDEVIFERGYGLADVEHQIPVKPETTFRIGSVTKQFTAAAILKLAEEDRLAVDEDMLAYLPEYPETEEVITLRHLLTHTSGIPSYTDLGEVFWRDERLDLTHDQLIAKFAELPLEFRPGQAWAYNNSGYYLLGVIIEKVTEQSYADYVEETLFEPLGLDTMRHGSYSAIVPDRAQGYRFQGGELHNDAFLSMNIPGAAGALLASAGDLVRWQIALTSGRIVSADSYVEMTTPFLLEDLSETNYGMGLVLDLFEGRPAVRHGGGIHGFNSDLAYLPEEGLSVAVISNSEGFPSGEVGSAILRALLAE